MGKGWQQLLTTMPQTVTDLTKTQELCLNKGLSICVLWLISKTNKFFLSFFLFAVLGTELRHTTTELHTQLFLLFYFETGTKLLSLASHLQSSCLRLQSFRDYRLCTTMSGWFLNNFCLFLGRGLAKFLLSQAFQKC